MITEIKKLLYRAQRLAAAATFAMAGFGAAALPGASVVVVGIGASIAMTETAVAATKAIPGIGISVHKRCGNTPCPTARKVKKQPPRSTGPRRPD